MSLASVLLFLIASAGMALILVDGKIMAPLRNYINNRPNLIYLRDIIECYQCCGFWTGIITGLVMFGITSVWSLFFLIVCGCAGSYASMWAAGHLGYLDTLANVDLEEFRDE